MSESQGPVRTGGDDPTKVAMVGLTFDDVREEAIDTFIIALDVALTPTGSVFSTELTIGRIRRKWAK